MAGAGDGAPALVSQVALHGADMMQNPMQRSHAAMALERRALARQQPPQRVAWSEHGLVAVATVVVSTDFSGSTVNSGAQDKRVQLQLAACSGRKHPIVVLHPNMPGEHTVLVNHHLSPVHTLLFAPRSYGVRLLSVDVDGRMLVWTGIRGCVNDFVASLGEANKAHALFPVIAARWITGPTASLGPIARTNAPAANYTGSLEARFARGMPEASRAALPQGFVSLYRDGTVALHLVPQLETMPWKRISGSLPCSITISHGAIDLVHEDGATRVVVAVTGADIGGEVLVFSITFEPVTHALRFTTRHRFFPGTPSTRLYGLYIETSQPSPGIIVLLTEDDSDDATVVERWESSFREMPLHAVFRAHPTQMCTWSKVASAHVEQGLVTSLAFTKDSAVCVLTVSNGNVLCKNSKTLADLLPLSNLDAAAAAAAATAAMVKHEGLADLVKPPANFYCDVPAMPLGAAISPNDACAVVFDMAQRISIFHFGHHLMAKSADVAAQARLLVDQTELAMIRGSDWWDLVCMALAMPTHAQVLPLLVSLLENDFETLVGPSQQFYSRLFESAKRAIARCLPEMHGTYLDAQGRSMIMLANALIRSALQVPENALKRTDLRGNEGDARQIMQSDQTGSRFALASSVAPLLPYFEWVADYALLFACCLDRWARTATDPAAVLSAAQLPVGRHLLKASDLFNLRMLLVYIQIFGSKPDTPAWQYTAAEVSALHAFVCSMTNELQSNPGGLSLAKVRQMLDDTRLPGLVCNGRPVFEPAAVFERLALDPPLVGFLERWRRTQDPSAKRRRHGAYQPTLQTGSFFPHYTPNLLPPQRRMEKDAVTRHMLANSAGLKQCLGIGCHRYTTLDSAIPIFYQSCPVCLGPWVLLPNGY